MTTALFMSVEQVEELTGVRQHAAQRRRLRAQGVVFRERADGFPVVLVTDLTAAKPAVPGSSRPNFAAVHRAG